ncbi:MAG: hypothetical protein HWN79_02125 [Candidatus Lokiarchaeota archaeon]|nr:hypothetical protein [Candidatus Lokiarchaeota archaeon]
MALVNRIVSNNSKRLTRAMNDSRYDAKYFENTEALLKKVSYKRIIDSFPY